jgi:hypothetical protein
MDRVDLLLLSVKAPLVDAVSATVCDRWREASDLWLEVYREPRYRALAALCGLEASLRAGLYDLSQYFHLGIDDRPALPAFLAEPWRESLPIRRSRARFYSCPRGPSDHAWSGRSIRSMVDLRLFREAIRDVFRRRLLQTDRGTAVRLLTKCYFALGEHEALLALHRSQRLYFGGPNARAMLETASASMTRETLGVVENTLEFVRRHPAGSVLTPLLDSPEAALAPHGRG